MTMVIEIYFIFYSKLQIHIYFCSCSVAKLCLTLCDPMDCSTPGLPDHHQLPDLAQTHVHQVGDDIQPSHTLSFTSGGQSINSFSISPSNEYLGLISFRIDWFDLAVQGTLKILFQHHSSKASIVTARSFLYSPTCIHT